jgi:maltose O-acetyltransferase
LDFGYNIEIGDNVFINYGCVFLDCNKIKIGNGTLLVPNVQIYSAAHPTDHRIRQKGLEYALPVTTGNDCRLGGGVIVCPGVTIGDIQR